MTWAGIGLGSNLGDSRDHLRTAITSLREHHRLLRISSLFQTAPVGPIDQPDFTNAAILVDTDAEPLALLRELHEVERSRGRDRSSEVRFGPRSLDLDILLWDGLHMEDSSLTIPHPRLAERRFALEPLIEVWPDATLPDGTRILDLWPTVAGQVSTKLQGPTWL
ncbi:MAG: 2-amino-4-hydroxy-6-hydroxymethyldihydropteridine diphosphokinase [Acidimicrobiia bacterium]|nr:2-amino-4-hydroxy-6-hydroxymethyldihydropteridine diphosphokinase [Acidimicrobiia bacterium]NNL27179.1 2-amino-4-hydroxy-6-hydroxymethyldihydropteridine diphosphokinase [Acidimicrobiia bacterium]